MADFTSGLKWAEPAVINAFNSVLSTSDPYDRYRSICSTTHRQVQTRIGPLGSSIHRSPDESIMVAPCARKAETAAAAKRRAAIVISLSNNQQGGDDLTAGNIKKAF